MGRLLISIVALPVVLLLIGYVNSYYKEWQYRRKAAALGCKLPPLRRYKYPGGIDMIIKMIKSDTRHRVPGEFERICFEEMKNKWTWRSFFFGDLVIFTIVPENIQAILAKQFDDFGLGSTRRGNFWPLLGNGIFTSDGADWAHSRALLRPQFARNLVAEVDLEEVHVQNLLKHIPKKTEDGWTDISNLQPLFFRLTLDSATEFLFGESVHSQTTSLPEELRRKEQFSNPTGLNLIEVGKAFDRSTHALGKRARLMEWYWLHDTKEFRDDCKLVHAFADFFVERALNSDLEKADQKHYIFLHELAKATRDPIELRSQLLNIFLAGRDTTAGLLGFVFCMLARHPDVFEKLRSIILQDFGTYENPKNISFSSLKSCTYLQHVMSETLRLFPSVPINGRRALRDTTIPVGGGPDGKSPIFVPKGVNVDYSVHCMHRRKDIWGEDANEFNPGRWLNRKVGWEYLPFNGGPRICLGQQFALTEAGYVIVRLLQKYDKIENHSDMLESDMQHQYSVTTAPWEANVRLHEASA